MNDDDGFIEVSGTIPVTIVSHRTKTSDSSEVVRQFQQMFPTARVESVNHELVRGLCHACGAPVLEKTRGYLYDPIIEAYVCPLCVQTQKESL